MSHLQPPSPRAPLLALVVFLTAGVLTAAAGDHHPRRARRAAVVQPVPTARVRDPVYGSRLGTFVSTPGIVVQGNFPAGGGYAPLGISGDAAMSLYGPLSSLRTTTAPVITYTRGYDGVVRPTTAITTTYPNLPYLSPFAYPTRANYYYAPRVLENPAEDSAVNWLDMN
jgi:hypothetical protein